MVLSTGFLKISNKVISILSLLKTTEGHLGTWDIFLWVFQVVKHGVFSPFNTLLLVGISVTVTFGLTRLSAKNTVKIWTNLVWTTLFYSVALETSSLEKSSTLLSITYFNI